MKQAEGEGRYGKDWVAKTVLRQETKTSVLASTIHDSYNVVFGDVIAKHCALLSAMLI